MSDLNLIAGEIASGINAFQGVRNQREAARRQSQQDARAEALFKIEQESHKSNEELNALRMQNESLRMKFSKNQESDRKMILTQSQDLLKKNSPFNARILAAEANQAEENLKTQQLRTKELKLKTDFTENTQVEAYEKSKLALEEAREAVTYRKNLSLAATAEQNSHIEKTKLYAEQRQRESDLHNQAGTKFVMTQMMDSINASKNAPLGGPERRAYGELLRDNIYRTGHPDAVAHGDNFFEVFMGLNPRASQENIIDDMRAGLLKSTPKSRESTAKLKGILGGIVLGEDKPSGGSSEFDISSTDKSLPGPVQQALTDVYRSSSYRKTQEYNEVKNLNISTSPGDHTQKSNFRKVIRWMEDAEKVMTGSASATVKTNAVRRIWKKIGETKTEKIGGKSTEVAKYGIHPEDNNKLREMFQQVIEAGTEFQLELDKPFDQRVKENRRDIEKAFGVKL